MYDHMEEPHKHVEHEKPDIIVHTPLFHLPKTYKAIYAIKNQNIILLEEVQGG